MRILMLSLNGAGEASTRYRFLQYARELERRGHSWRMSTFYSALPPPGRGAVQKLAAWTLGLIRQVNACVRSGRFDCVVIQRFICPYVANDLVAALSVPVVYDFDDAIWMSAPPRFTPVDPEQSFARLCRGAKIVLAGNAFLAEKARQCATSAAEVRVVPTVVDTKVFVRAAARSPIPLLGWIGSPSAFPYLQTKLPLLDALAKKRRFRLRVVGAGQRVRLRNLQVEQPPWNEAAEAGYFSDLDIGLYPLADDIWSQGKCALKSLQYMSAQVPHVASPFGGVKEVCAEADNALFAESDDAWTDALCRLLDDDALRARLAESGRARVEAAYSLQRWEKTVVSVYEIASCA